MKARADCADLDVAREPSIARKLWHKRSMSHSIHGPDAMRQPSCARWWCMLRCASACVALLCTFSSATVQAGPVEQLVDLAIGPGQSAAIVTRYENGGGGLIYGAQGDRSWRLQCGSAHLIPSDASHGPLVILANDTLLVGTSRGVVAGSLDGCGSTLEPLANGAEVIDLVADPTDANAAIALAFAVGMSPSSTSLWRRAASGAWSMLGVADAALATSMRAASVDGHLRLYETAVLTTLDEDAGTRYYTYQVRYSDDGANTFQAFAVSTDGSPRIVGVDPSNPDRIALLIDQSSAADSILVSHERGAKLTPYLQVGEFGALAFAPDGRVWIGGRTSASDSLQGLWAAPDLDTAPVRLAMADYTVQCLSYHAPSNTLYACKNFWLGEVEPASGAFASVMSFAAVSDLVNCDGSSTAQLCEAQLCSAYCGPGHFAVAPACAAYDAPGCGVAVAMQEAADTMRSPASAFDAGSESPTAAGGARAAADGGKVDAGTAARAAAKGSCAVVVVRAGDRAPYCTLWVALCVRAVRRRVRRAPRRR
jgi:hypothetical protein